MFGQRLRRWPNINPTQGWRQVLAVTMCRVMHPAMCVNDNQEWLLPDRQILQNWI